MIAPFEGHLKKRGRFYDFRPMPPEKTLKFFGVEDTTNHWGTPMNRDQRNVVVEYVSVLSEDQLRLLTLQLNEKLSGDLGDALNFMSRDRRMDYMIGQSGDAWSVYNVCDQIRDVCQKECRRRNVNLKR